MFKVNFILGIILLVIVTSLFVINQYINSIPPIIITILLFLSSIICIYLVGVILFK